MELKVESDFKRKSAKTLSFPSSFVYSPFGVRAHAYSPVPPTPVAAAVSLSSEYSGNPTMYGGQRRMPIGNDKVQLRHFPLPYPQFLVNYCSSSKFCVL